MSKYAFDTFCFVCNQGVDSSIVCCEKENCPGRNKAKSETVEFTEIKYSKKFVSYPRQQGKTRNAK